MSLVAYTRGNLVSLSVGTARISQLISVATSVVLINATAGRTKAPSNASKTRQKKKEGATGGDQGRGAKAP